MRGSQNFQRAMFSYVSLEERVPAAHPLRKLRALVGALLASMDKHFEAVYARRGGPLVPPDVLLKALLLQILFSIRSERQLVGAIDYNLLYGRSGQVCPGLAQTFPMRDKRCHLWRTHACHHARTLAVLDKGSTR
jgi:hypothetical protein